MTEHLSSKQIESYSRRIMSPADFLVVSDHLAGCDFCRRLAGEAAEIQSKFTSFRTGLRDDAVHKSTHLRYEQLVAYVDQTADDVEREILESHMEVCPACKAEAEDLGALKATPMSYPGKSSAPDRQSTFWRGFILLWQRPFYRFSLGLAGATAAILLTVFIATLPLRKQVADLHAKLEEAQRQNDELQKQSSTIEELQAQLKDLRQSGLNSSVQVGETLVDAGGTIGLDNRGNVSGMESIPAQVQIAIKAALTGHAEASPELRRLIPRAGVLMGGASEGVSFALVAPVGTAVETDRPAFRWRALAEAVSYVVNVYDSKLQNVAVSEPVSSPEWTPKHPLKRGEVYTWQVTATKAGEEITSPVPPAPEAKFKVLEQSKVHEVSHIRNSYPESHLTLGSVYGKAGLLDDAEREFKLLLSANPNSAVAQKLLQNLKSLRQK